MLKGIDEVRRRGRQLHQSQLTDNTTVDAPSRASNVLLNKSLLERHESMEPVTASMLGMVMAIVTIVTTIWDLLLLSWYFVIIFLVVVVFFYYY